MAFGKPCYTALWLYQIDYAVIYFTEARFLPSVSVPLTQPLFAHPSWTLLRCNIDSSLAPKIFKWRTPIHYDLISIGSMFPESHLVALSIPGPDAEGHMNVIGVHVLFGTPKILSKIPALTISTFALMRRMQGISPTNLCQKKWLLSSGFSKGYSVGMLAKKYWSRRRTWS